jgi:hypothetical protein
VNVPPPAKLGRAIVSVLPPEPDWLCQSIYSLLATALLHRDTHTFESPSLYLAAIDCIPESAKRKLRGNPSPDFSRLLTPKPLFVISKIQFLLIDLHFFN